MFKFRHNADTNHPHINSFVLLIRIFAIAQYNFLHLLFAIS
jgi:hypothetical protein